ncbi:MAG: AI-2E family transporter [bacterium]
MENSYQRFKNLLLDPRFFALLLVIAVGALLVAFFRNPLLPFLLALVLAYFLDGVVKQVMAWKDHRGLAVAITYSLFLVFYLVGIFGPLQLAVRQAVQLVRSLPRFAGRLQELSNVFVEYLTELIPLEQHEQVAGLFAENVKAWGEALLLTSIAGIGQATTWAINLLLIPLLVFFLLKDKLALQRAFVRLLPRERELVERVWREMEGKLANYVRGKVWEILIVGTVSSLAFILLGFGYAAMMGLVTGFSVVVPFVGAIGTALPLFVLGYLQWGPGWDLGWLMIVYTVIQLLDGNLLAPLILSEAVKLHPIFILLAVFVFGSLWGFWGVFFAIPLATLAKSVLDAFFSLSD